MKIFPAYLRGVFHAVSCHSERAVDAVPDAVGAILVDWEGERYRNTATATLRYTLCRCPQGIILSRLRETHAESQGGEIEDVVITSERQDLLIGTVDPDYSLYCRQRGPVRPGLARHHFNNALTL